MIPCQKSIFSRLIKVYFRRRNTTPMKYLFLGLLLLIGFAKAKAQQMDSFSLKEVTIMDDRIPAKISETGRAVTVITAEQIGKTNAVSLNEVLSFVNGVDVRQRGPLGVQADIGIRGGSFDQTQVLINGMKVSDPQTGHHNMNLPIALENIERIEVIKGPAARLYGANAFAGVINIITKPGKERNVFVSGSYGQHNLYSGNVTVNLPGKKVKQTISLSASGSDTFVYNTDFTIRNAFYQLETQIGKTEVGFLAAANCKKFGANSFYASTNFRDQYEETQTYFSGINLSRSFENGWTLRAKGYGRLHEDHYVLFRDRPEVYENFHTSGMLAAEIGVQKQLQNGSLNLGFDTRNESLQSSNLGEHSRYVTGGFIDYRYLYRKFLVNPGVNVSVISGFEPQVFPGLDIAYMPNQGLTWYASTGRAYRVPTYTDWFYLGPENIGNPELTPETAWNIEVGAKRNHKYYQLNTAVFRKEATNAIEWVRENKEAKWQPQNFHNVTTMGFEADIALDMERLWKTQSFFNNISLSYTHLNTSFSVNEELLSKYQIENIRHQVIGRLSHNIARGVQHQIGVRLIDRYHFVKSYMVVDSRLYKDTGKYKVFVEATNLLNVDYRETNLVQMPGRWIRIGASAKIGF